MNKFNIEHWLYRNVFRPFLFTIDCEKIHEQMTTMGESFENMDFLIENVYSYKNEKLRKTHLGIVFDNPIGLSAGFDYDGHLAKAMKHIGFGFNTVGTVTAKPYKGNKRPMLARLVKSQSILVNKGFKSEGAKKVAERLDRKNLKGHTIGISIGSSNVPSVNTIAKAIEDYVYTFNIFKNKLYVKYFEINISCPNTAMTESFSTPKNFEKLLNRIAELNIKQPLFIKMPNEISFKTSDKLVVIGLKHGIRGYIFSNLVKDRNNPLFDKNEIKQVKTFEGNFSGKPSFVNSNNLLAHTRKVFKNKVVLIGCGGVFNYLDTLEKFKSGADLVQLITGMIFEGPQIAGEINQSLIESKDFSKIQGS